MNTNMAAQRLNFYDVMGNPVLYYKSVGIIECYSYTKVFWMVARCLLTGSLQCLRQTVQFKQCYKKYYKSHCAT